MASSLQMSCSNFQTWGSNSTAYTQIGFGGMSNNSIEGNQTRKVRTAGKFKNLYCRVPTNGVTAATTIRLRKNTANGNLSVSVGSGATGEFEDTVNSDSVVAGDALVYQIVTGATGTNIGWTIGSMLFDASTNTESILLATGNTTWITASTTYFARLGGQDDSLTTESFAQIKCETAGTLEHLFIKMSANDRANATTLRTRINGVDGTCTISIGAGVTGDLEDTTHSDTVNAGDLINIATTTGIGTTSFTLATIIAVEFKTTNLKSLMSSGRSTSFSTTTTNYLPFGGQINSEATESNHQLKTRVGATFSNLQCNLSANTITAASTLTFRKNATAGNQSVSITASTTGLFEDTANSDVVVATDEINTKLVTGGTGTSLLLQIISVMMTMPPPPINQVMVGQQADVRIQHNYQMV